MESVLAIDPGPTESAWVHYSMNADRVVRFGTCDNVDMLSILDFEFGFDEEGGRDKYSIIFVIEQVTSYGKPVGASVFDTCFWTGRFAQAWVALFMLYPRRRVKKVLLGKDKGGDPEVRAAVIAHFGGKEKAIGNKAEPGQLHKMKEHEWQACGLALAYARELMT